MLDLYNNKYDRETLKAHIYAVNLMDIVQTQIIDTSFAVRYILNDKYHFCKNDIVTVKDVLKWQPHITHNELMQMILEYESDDDSVCDFETISNN